MLDGGAPVLGEPLPVDLLNTEYAVSGAPRDGLTRPGELAFWLRAVRDRVDVPLPDDVLTGVTAAHLRDFRALRATVRAVVLADAAPDPSEVDALNAFSALAPTVPVLTWSDEPAREAVALGDPVLAVATVIAQQAVDLVTGEARGQLRACHGPGCVLHFVRTSARREWCSPACGNRARVARHHQRHKAAGSGRSRPPA